MKNIRKIIRQMIYESFDRQSSMINENFYLYDPTAAADPTHDKGWTLYQPLAEKIVDYLANIERLPRFENRMSKPRIVASGAEGIVVSLDDFKVIKLFHTIDNAAKNLGFVSRSDQKTAKVYSKGVINLDKPVVYWKQGSTHNRRNKNYQINRLYYIIMERITPDRYVFRNISTELNKFIQVRHVKFNNLINLYNLGGSVAQRIEGVYLDILAAAYPQQKFLIKYGLNTFQKLVSFINNPATPPKQKRRIAAECNNLFVTHGKLFPKAVLATTDSGGSLTLKMLCLNVLGIVRNFSVAVEFNRLFDRHISNINLHARKKLASNRNQTLGQDYDDILDLIEEIIVKSGDYENDVPALEWRDIHEEQFGRRADGELVALDIGGVDRNLDAGLAASQFETNVSNINMDVIISDVRVDSPDPAYRSYDYMYDVDIDNLDIDDDTDET